MGLLDDARRLFVGRARAQRALRRAAKTFWDALEPEEKRRYDGGSRGRRFYGWQPTGGSANAEVAMDAAQLRKRSRDLIRNNRNAAKALSSLVSNLVGDGFQLRVDTGDDKLDRRVIELWDEWGTHCEASGAIKSFGGVQTLVARAFFESGEVFPRARPRRAGDGLSVPLQLQVLEAEQVDASKNEILTSKDAGFRGRIVQGIEHDPLDRRRAFWVHPFHPGDIVVPVRGGLESKPVPASQMAHVFEVGRPGQVRGVPWLSPIITDMRDLDDYRDAELVRKKVEACVTGFIYGGDGGDSDGIGPVVTEIDGDNPVEMLEPGLIAHVRHGKEIKFNTPAQVGGYAEYMRTELQGIAAGARMTYEILSGDLSAVNYSSIRAGLIEFRRMMRALQLHAFVGQFLNPTFGWWLVSAVGAGLLPDVQYRTRWVPPRFDEVDREKEARADALEILHLLSSRTDISARRGKDLRETLAELGVEREQIEALGIVPADTVTGVRGRTESAD